MTAPKTPQQMLEEIVKREYPNDVFEDVIPILVADKIWLISRIRQLEGELQKDYKKKECRCCYSAMEIDKHRNKALTTMPKDGK